MSPIMRSIAIIATVTVISLPSEVSAQPGQRLYSLGLSAYFDGDFARAETMFSGAIKANKKDPRGYFYRGLARTRLDKADDAKADFKKGAQIEANIGDRSLVSAALRRIQGPVRKQIEMIRLTTRPPRKQYGPPVPVAGASPKPATTPAPAANPVPATNPAPKPAPMPETTTPAVEPKPATPTDVPDTGAAKINLDLLPPDADVFVVVRVAEIWKSPLAQNFTAADEVTQGLALMRQMVGITPDKIDSITLASASTVGHAMKLAANPAGGSPTDLPDEWSAVARLSADFSDQALKQLPFVTEKDVDGVPYLSVADPDGEGDPIAVFAADDRTVLIGSTQAVEAGINQQQKPSRPDLNFLDASSHVLVAFAPKDLTALRQMIPPAQPTDPNEAMMMAVAKEAKAVALGLKVTDGVGIKVQLQLETPARATSLVQFTQPLVAQGKGMLGLFGAQLPPEATAVATAVLDSVKASSTDALFELELSIPASVKDLLQMLPQLLGGA